MGDRGGSEKWADSRHILKRMRLAVIPAWGGDAIREREGSRMLQFEASAPG